MVRATHGHFGVTRLLLTRDDVDHDTSGYFGQTPLSSAAAAGHERVVRLLLARDDVNPDAQDEYRYGSAQEDVVRLLLGQNDLNPERGTAFGHTPLTAAYEAGHRGIVEMIN